MSDLIAAIATPLAPSAIGILRLSGPGAAQAVVGVFTPASGRPFASYPPQTLVLGTLRDREGRLIDQCLATWSRCPHSYTGEETAELQCHSSPAVLQAGLDALFSQGARQALPGEFTRRAFLNGKLDLTQAEAVIDLIDAQTQAAARNAAGQLSGAMRRKITAIYDSLVDLMAHFHVVLDYPDEDIDPFEAQEITDTVDAAVRALDQLLSTFRRGRQLTEGVPCAIVGRPNAGKSTLFNTLLGYDRAIVTDIPGTTRDTLEEKLTLGGVLLRLIDTAGLRDTEDEVERIGVERSRAALEGAELALILVDSTTLRSATQADLDEWNTLAASVPKALMVLTKQDAAEAEPHLLGVHPPVVAVSAVTGEGLDALEEAVADLFPTDQVRENGELLTNARQAQAAERARDALRRVSGAMRTGMTPDAVLTDVEEAMAALGEITGTTLREDVTDRIFQRFCVGK